MRLLFGLALALPIFAADVDGIRLHWSSSGKGNKAVILVHGWTGDSSMWSAQVPVLAEKYRIVTLDLPGHGQSGSPADGKFSMDLFARAVEAVRRAAKVKKAVLVGHSMGTPVVRQYARLYPKRTAALVLVDGVVAKPENAGIYATISKQFVGPGGLKAREDFVRSMFTAATPEHLRPEILKITASAPEATATGAMLSMADPAVWKEDVLQMPVLAIYADRSRLANREYMKQLFPALEYFEIPATDHFLMMEKPDEFNRLLLTFLDKLKL